MKIQVRLADKIENVREGRLAGRLQFNELDLFKRNRSYTAARTAFRQV